MHLEFADKLARIRAFLKETAFDALLLSRNENFCWLSCGHYAFVDKGSPDAVAKLLVTADRQYLFCNSSESPRVPTEELAGLGFEPVVYPWYASAETALNTVIGTWRVASDNGILGTTNCAEQIQRMRYCLTDDEIARYREIAPETARVVEQCCRKVEKNTSEYEIAGRVTGELMALGYQLPVCLVAADERLEQYRHPLPTAKRVERRVMIAVCAQKYGLTVSLSRIVSLEPLPLTLREKHAAVTAVDAAYIAHTVEGARTGEIVAAGHAVYASRGFENDFHLHHQGGGLGYLTRDYCANETCAEIVHNRQAFSWNPTIAGTKSEDTILVLNGETQILSHTGAWPYLSVQASTQTLLRPDILTL